MQIGVGQYEYQKRADGYSHGVDGMDGMPNPVSLIDMRPDELQAKPADDPNGWCFVTGEKLPDGVELIAESGEAQPTRRAKEILISKFGYLPDGDTAGDMILDVLTNRAHPDGVLGHRPMQPTFEGTLEIPGIIKPRKFGLRLNAAGTIPLDTYSERLIELIQIEAKPDILRALEGKDASELYRKKDGYTQEKLGVEGQLFISPELRGEVKPSRDPETTWNDLLTQANSATLGDGNWTEYQDFLQENNKARPNAANTDSLARYNKDLSGSDVEAWCNFDNMLQPSGTFIRVSVALRFSTIAASCYILSAARVSTDRLFGIEKFVAGVRSAITASGGSSGVTQWSGSAGILWGRVNGSALLIRNPSDTTKYLGGVDVTFASGTRGGIGYNTDATTFPNFWGFVIRDQIKSPAFYRGGIMSGGAM